MSFKKHHNRCVFRALLLHLLICSGSVYAQSQSIPDLVATVGRSVVWIHAFGMPSMGSAGQYGTGSGYIVANGRVVTNYHVVKGANGVVVYLPSVAGDRAFYATVVAMDSVHDLAVLNCRDLPGRPLSIADSGEIRQGDATVVLGFPGGVYNPGTMKVSSGIISNDPREEILQVTAAINHGNSGGPCIGPSGTVIGTVFARPSSELDVQGTGYVVSNRYLRGILDRVPPESGKADDYFGTKSFDAYAKLCEAEMNAWRSNAIEDIVMRRDAVLQAQNLTKQAIDLDGNYAEAHYFLASYFLVDAFICCARREYGCMERKTKDFLTEMDRARALTTKFRYNDSDATSIVYSMVKSRGDLPCADISRLVDAQANVLREIAARRDELERYIARGDKPERLAQVLNGRYDSGRVPPGRTPWLIGRPITFFVRTLLLPENVDANAEIFSNVYEVEIGVEVLDNIRPTVGRLISNSVVAQLTPGWFLGCGLGPLTLRYFLSRNRSVLAERWRVELSSDHPGRTEFVSSVWYIGVGQFYQRDGLSGTIDPTTSPPDLVHYAARIGLQFKLATPLWADLAYIHAINSSGQPALVVAGVGARF